MGCGDLVVRLLRLCPIFRHERIGRLADGGGFHQVQTAQRLALLADVLEHLGRCRIGNAREVDLEKLGKGFAVIGRMQHAVDIVEHLDLGRPRIAGGGPEPNFVIARSGTTRRSSCLSSRTGTGLLRFARNDG